MKNIFKTILLGVLLVSCGTENNPTYTLATTVSPAEGGTISPSSGIFSKDEVITLTATPSSDGWRFVRWEGDWDGSVNPVNLAIDRNFSVIGIFERTTVTNPTVTNPTTGRVWMDRNLGASRAATPSTYTGTQAYGDLYQWGRAADGHEKRNSPTTSTIGYRDQPGHGSFILAPNSPYDWISLRNNNLWQGVNGVNNPCPTGYRLPTEAEWEAERNSWSSNNASGAFNSPLKLPMAGGRSYSSGSLFNFGSNGVYWSSTVSGSLARRLYFDSTGAFMSSHNRASGSSVRCIRD